MSHALNPTQYFDGGYIAFRSMVQNVKLPSDLCLVSWYRGSASGRRQYGALIRSERWAPAKMDVSELPVREFDPTRHVNIHFEPQAQAVTGRLTLYLHYEINPYKTKRWAEKNLPASRYDEYQDVRIRFYHELRGALSAPWRFYKGSNMLAKVPFAKDTTVREVVGGMSEAVALAEPVVDGLIQEVVLP